MENDDNDTKEAVTPKPKRRRSLMARIADSVGVAQRDILAHKVYGQDVVVVTSRGRKVRAKLNQD